MSDWANLRAARLPATTLALLAAVRCQAGVTAHVDGDSLWLEWNEPASDWARSLLPFAGVRLYERRGDRWFPFGDRLPCAGPPTGPGATLASLLPVPGVEWRESDDAVYPSELRIVRGGTRSPVTALRCEFADLAIWAENAPGCDFDGLRAARWGETVLIVGERLPWWGVSPDAVRFTGRRVLVPVGYRVEPSWPEAWLLTACGVQPGERLLLNDGRAQIIAEDVLLPLTRAGVRLTQRETGAAGGRG